MHTAKMPVASGEVECVAVVTSRVSQALTTESNAPIMKVLVHDDQYVHQGDVIAQLDVSELRSKLNSQRGQLARAQGQASRAYAQATSAQQSAHVAGIMARVGAGSPEEMRKLQAEASAAGGDGAAAAGEISAAKADIAETERLIAAADIKAPIDGTVSMLHVHEGEMAHAGATLGRVFDPTDLQVKFAVPRAHGKAIKVGDKVQLDYEGDQKLPAVVSDVIDANDVAVDFLQVIAQIDKSSHPDVRVGIRGYVRIADKGAVR